MGSEYLLRLVEIFGGALALAIPASLLYLNERKKNRIMAEQMDVEGAEILASGALALLTPYQDRVVYLEKEIKELREQVSEMRRRVTAVEVENESLAEWSKRLVAQVESLGNAPVRRH